MKLLDRLINIIFSLAIIVISVTVLLVICNHVESNYINGLINDYVWNPEYKYIVGVVSFIVLLAGLKTTIFLSDFKKKRKIPIMVNSQNGSVQIAQETIESTAKAVACTHEEVKDVNVKMLNKNKGIEVFMSLLVAQDTNIKEITSQIQEEVKEKIFDTTGVKVLNTDIKVKNIIEKGKKMATPSSNEPLFVKGKLETQEEVINKEENKEEPKVEEAKDEEPIVQEPETQDVTN